MTNKNGLEQLGALVGHGARAEVYAWGEGKVLKLFWEGTRPEGTAGEAMASKAVHDAGLPVPDCFGTVTVNGRHGIIFERIDGPAMREHLLGRPWLVDRMAWRTAELHAAMHGIVVPDTYPAQRPALERSIRAATQLCEEVKAAVLEALRRLPDGDRLCHGDFHPGNILLGPKGPVIIDWPGAKRGNPVADVARTVLLLRNGPAHIPQVVTRLAATLVSRRFITIYLRRYAELRPLPRAELDSWLPVLAAARLCEGIKEEESRLVACVSQPGFGCFP